MSMQAKRKCLTISQKLNIIQELESDSPPSKRKLAREKNVSEGTIRKIWNNRDILIEKSSIQPNSYNSEKTRLAKPKYDEIENKLFEWINVSKTLLFITTE